MANVVEPNVKIYTYDYTTLSPRVDFELNVAMAINSDCGPVDRNRINNQGELIRYYLSGSSITALDDITIKTCAKLLQFTPVWVTRAFDNTVLAGLSDTGNTIYTDTDFNVYGRSIQYVIEKKVKTPVVSYVALEWTNPTTSTKTTYLIYVGDATKIPASAKTGRTLISWTLKDTDEQATGASADTGDQLPTLENLFYNINDIINENSELETAGIPAFLKVVIDDYITAMPGPGVRIVEVGHDAGNDIVSFKTSTVTSKFQEFDFTTNTTRSLTQSNYISLGGLTYYNEGVTSSNVSYPNKLVPITFFHGNRTKNDHVNSPTLTELNQDKIDSVSFLTYMVDEIVKSDAAVKPEAFRGRYTFNFGATKFKYISFVGDYSSIKFVDANLQIKGLTTRKVNGKESVEYKGDSTLIIETSPITKAIENFGIVLSDVLDPTASNANLAVFYVGTVPNSVLSNEKNVLVIDLSSEVCTLQKLLFRISEYCDPQFRNTSIAYSYSNFVTKFAPVKATVTINDAVLLYNKVELSSYEINMPSGVVTELATPIQTIYTHNISGSEINSENSLIMDSWVKLQTYSVDYDVVDNQGNNPKNYSTKYCFYVGNYISDDPDEDVIRLSAVALTYKQFLSKLRRAVGDLVNTTNTANGFTIYDYDDGETRELTVGPTGSSSLDTPAVLERDLTGNTFNGSFAVINRGPSKTRIYKFGFERSEDDPEIYDFTFSNNGTETDYSISFVGDKIDTYGRNIYYNYVNELNTNKFFTIIRLNEEKYPQAKFQSRMFGNEVPVEEPESDDYIAAFQRYRKFNGVYYDFFFDGGFVNTSLAKALAELGKDLYAEALISMPDIKDVAQLAAYRQSLGIDHWEGRVAVPVCPDTTIGDFVTYCPANVFYLERVFANKGAGKEFAPVFGITNGRMSLVPKYKYEDIENERNYLLNNQINVIIWDEAEQTAQSNLDLTLQKADSTLSNCNNARIINSSAHVMDRLMKNYIGRFNDVKTRNNVISAATYSLNSRLVANQEYAPDTIRVVCNETNNPVEVQENRELVVDLLYKLRDGIREVKVYQKIYKLSQNLDEV